MSNRQYSDIISLVISSKERIEKGGRNIEIERKYDEQTALVSVTKYCD
jgi:hypothetical protein